MWNRMVTSFRAAARPFVAAPRRCMSSHTTAAAAARGFAMNTGSRYGSRQLSSAQRTTHMSTQLAWPAASASLLPRRHLFIQTQETPNPSSLKFLPGRAVLPPAPSGSGSSGSGSGNQGGASAPRTLDFQSFRAAQQRSPLAARLFGVEGVTGVFLGPDFVAVSIGEGASWSLVKPHVFAALGEHFDSGQPVVHEVDEAAAAKGAGTASGTGPSHDTAIKEDDDEVVALIKELIETRIRPTVQEDGGDITYRGFDPQTGVVRLQLQGSCVGCPSSAVTLKSGIENMLKHYVQEVESVEEWKDEQLDSVNQAALDKLEQGLKTAKAGAPAS